MGDPAQFFARLVSSAGPAAKKLAMAKLRPVLEPHVKRQGLAWEDVLPILDTVDTAKELQEARLGGLFVPAPRQSQHRPWCDTSGAAES